MVKTIFNILSRHQIKAKFRNLDFADFHQNSHLIYLIIQGSYDLILKVKPDDEDFDKWAEGQKPPQNRPPDQKIDMDDMLRELGIDPKNANFPQKYFACKQ